ncbi:MAG: DUF1599 domain-containing protein [Candidatus Blackburnbacteria bacterium]|nr:DUF1599 domain-containing protein [Candidatus Blackburnbacteria bacterium]
MKNPRFAEILKELEHLHAVKNEDYAGSIDPLNNFKDFGFVGAVVRIGDKYNRVKNFVKKGEYKVKSESVIDTLRDLAVYAVIAIQLYERETNKDKGHCPACNRPIVDENQRTLSEVLQHEQ